MQTYVVECGGFYANFSTDSGYNNPNFVVRQVTWEAGKEGRARASHFFTAEQAEHAMSQVIGLDVPMTIEATEVRR